MKDVSDFDDDRDFCEGCGRELGTYDSGEGCPMCKECGGIYAPGTEECDWCPYSDECSKDYAARYQQ